ncbi:MAG TPA: ABC transporter substrate-binding protein [Lachnoclostridium phytofermentans]|uniref:ABC transporter substrate-binding protein n=1 Tax=Lachnoclostridium phytofermentans TaxID=66219 RepID=A0A3D2X7J0_9FIRM|nr:ABC transporter substrate-binding protein [Lachnoclostridium sp.]HCL02697.1 ABC transporter substrate-binding protein [Lachnoclostridium phytofermentans]
MKRRKQLFFLGLLLSCMIALCACSGSTENKGNDQKEAENGEASKNGGSVIVGITNDLDSLDPHKAVAAGTKEVLFNIFEGLVKPDKDGNLVPAVASDYKISEDGMTYTFFLRDGVKFHNGALVTVDDVIYSLKRATGLLETSDPEVRVESVFSCVESINAITTEDGKQAVEVKLNQPNIELLSYFTISIIPKDYTEQATKPVGTGPFRFVSYSPMVSIVMEKNPDYYMKGVPYLDEVTFKISANTDAAFMELRAGTIDIFQQLTYEQANELKDLYSIEIGHMNLVQALFLNHKAAPFDNLKVRQALCYAIDRQMILDIVAGGNGTIIGSNMFPGFGKYYDETLANYYTYDVEKAKQLLNEAGYPDGFHFTITVPSNYQAHVDTAQVIVEQLKKVGITAEIKLVEWASWISDVYQGRNYESTIVGLDSNLSPSDIVKRYESTSKNNFLNYSNSQFDSLYPKAYASVKDEEKVELYHQLQRILTEDVASVYIQDPANLVAVNKKLAGYQFYPVYVQDMSTVYYK